MNELGNNIKEILLLDFEKKFNKDNFFIVDIKIYRNLKKILIIVDGLRELSIDDCVTINRYLRENNSLLDEYDLEVSTPGIGSKIIDIRQLYKRQGKMFSIDVDGQIKRGILKEIKGDMLFFEINEKKGERNVMSILFNKDKNIIKEVIMF